MVEFQLNNLASKTSLILDLYATLIKFIQSHATNAERLAKSHAARV